MLNKIAHVIDEFTARPAATLISLALVLLRLAYGPITHYSALWLTIGAAASGVPPFVMVFALQNAQKRDTLAMHVKMDELLRAVETANNRLIGVERLEPEEINKLRHSFEPGPTVNP